VHTLRIVRTPEEIRTKLTSIDAEVETLDMQVRGLEKRKAQLKGFAEALQFALGGNDEPVHIRRDPQATLLEVAVPSEVTQPKKARGIGRGIPPTNKGQLSPTSMAGRTFQLMKDRGVPMTPQEVVDALGFRNSNPKQRKQAYNNVSGLLSKYHAEHRFFRRTEAGKYVIDERTEPMKLSA
jgi:hypothetical protein